MSLNAAPSVALRDPPAVSGLALGLALGVGAALFGAAGLVFAGVAAYFSLTPYLEPRWAALAVAAASLLLAAAIGLIARLLMRRALARAADWAKSSAVIALAPHVLRFAVKHARLVGLASAAGAVFYAARSGKAA